MWYELMSDAGGRPTVPVESSTRRHYGTGNASRCDQAWVTAGLNCRSTLLKQKLGSDHLEILSKVCIRKDVNVRKIVRRRKEPKEGSPLYIMKCGGSVCVAEKNIKHKTRI